MKICIYPKLWIILVAVSTSLTNCGIISSNIDLNNFNDDWNYHTSPSKIPILKTEAKIHELPQTSYREAKESPDDPLQILDLNDPGILGDSVGHLGDSVRSKIPCGVCKIGVGLLQNDVQKDVPVPVIKAKFVSLCVGFEIQNEVVCNGIFDTFSPDILPALKVTKLGPQEMCSLIIGEACDKVEIPTHEWKVSFPDYKKTAVRKSDSYPNLDVKNPTLKVLQISDTHYDPDYLEGSIANCGEPLCCRENSSPPKKNGVILPAGKWGSYGYCDVPKILIDNMLTNIIRQHPDIDYIIWTGDIPPHDIWNQTKLESLDLLKEGVRQMLTAFPNIPVFPALGNHEGIPAGNFPPPWNKHENHSISWLYEEANKQWKKWIPDSEDSNILHGGFYSVIIRPGLRLISINTNYCHSFSWWLLVNSTDPAKELQWLVHQLQEAEDNGEKVHIIGHIPPGGTDCLKTWSENYYAIVNRYEHTITAQFFGHSHADEFEVFYDNKNYARPINVAYMGPSVTPYSGQNPAYRIYYVDGEHQNTTWEILDHETWIMDLDRANSELLDNPEWFMLYSAKNSYGMTSLRPFEWGNLIQKMARNNKLFDQFYRYYYRDSPTSPKYSDKEKLQILCDLKSGKSHDRHHLCHDLEVLIHS